jgi:eukaryotic-like serine/threonine-protein kinase
VGNDSESSAYRRIAELGRGGMAQVHLATRAGAHGVSKLIVIKELRPELAAEESFRRMFVDEARLATRLNHPNVVQTFEVTRDGDRDVMVMEYLEGQSLATIRKGVRAELLLPLELHVIACTLAGLEYAHDLRDHEGRPFGVVHRDVSPHNVFVTYSGEVKVVDFGIAKAADSSVHTETGTFKGKLAYMAPEQARGEKVDGRADLFSVGVMLWEALAGRRLWKGLPDTAILHQLMQGKFPSPREFNANVPRELEAIVARALAVNREERFANAREFRASLEAFATTMTERPSRQVIGELVASAFAAERRRVRALVDEHHRVAATSSAELPALVPPAATSGHYPGQTESGAGLTAQGASLTLNPRRMRTERMARRTLVLGAIVAAGALGAFLFVKGRASSTPPPATSVSFGVLDATTATAPVSTGVPVPAPSGRTDDLTASADAGAPLPVGSVAPPVAPRPPAQQRPRRVKPPPAGSAPSAAPVGTKAPGAPDLGY